MARIAVIFGTTDGQTARIARHVAEAFSQYGGFRLVDAEGQAYTSSPQPS